MLALKLEGEVICKMPAFVISAEQPKGVRIPDLERPEVENTLSPRLANASPSTQVSVPLY